MNEGFLEMAVEAEANGQQKEITEQLFTNRLLIDDPVFSRSAAAHMLMVPSVAQTENSPQTHSI